MGLLLPKPARGSTLLEKRAKRAAIKTHEQTEKAKVVKRDGSKHCRLVPGCSEREKFETAHLENKGMGGDHGNRTDASILLRCCLFHHRGDWSLHSGDLKVEYLTAAKADGPIQVHGRDSKGQWYVICREIAVNVCERD